MNNQTYFCGIDVAKDFFVVSIKNGSFVIKNKIFNMDIDGFQNFQQTINNFKNSIIIGMEPSGIYHLNLFNFLKSHNYNTIILNPYTLHQFFKFTNNKPSKTDKKDSQTIAQFLEFNQNQLQTINKDDQRYHLKYFLREKEKIIHQIAQTKTEIKRIISIIFPELEKFNIFTNNILSLLAELGGAYTIKNMPKDEFIKKAQQICNTNPKGRKNILSYEKIYQLAQNSIASYYPEYEIIIKFKINKLNNLIQQKYILSNIIQQHAQNLFKTQIQILTSIPGIAKETAISFIAEIVDIKRFSNYRKLVGFCGLDPIIKQSGKFKTSYKISKKGNAHARRIVWIMANCTKKYCPYFRNYYIKKRNQGKSFKEAVIAVASKLLRVIYALLNENRTFK